MTLISVYINGSSIVALGKKGPLDHPQHHVNLIAVFYPNAAASILGIFSNSSIVRFCRKRCDPAFSFCI